MNMIASGIGSRLDHGADVSDDLDRADNGLHINFLKELRAHIGAGQFPLDGLAFADCDRAGEIIGEINCVVADVLHTERKVAIALGVCERILNAARIQSLANWKLA